jgi:hypothetical protein
MDLKKTIVIIAGLGKFYGAGRRLYIQIAGLSQQIESVFIDSKKLALLAREKEIDESIFSPNNRGYGFWQWKLFLIDYYLGAGFENLIYIDAGCDIEPTTFLSFIDWFNNVDYKLILSKTGHNIASYTKPCVIDELNVNRIDAKNTEMLQAGFVCLKNDSNIKNCFRKACDYVLNGRQDLFDDTIRSSEYMPNYFIDHRHDQSVLSLLILNDDSISEVGILPTGLTPPCHTDWCSIPPVIASRNGSCISLYWPLINYGVNNNFPKYLKWQIKLMNKIAKIFGYPAPIINFFNGLFELQFKRIKFYGDSQSFSDITILKPPVLMDLKKWKTDANRLNENSN